MSGNGSVLALWRADADAPVADGPVVYLDSEGDPRGVVARSVAELLTLLPYGTVFLYEVLRGKTPSPTDALAALEPTEDDEPFVAWWQGQFGVAPAADPIAVIGAARRDHAAVEAWLAGS